MSKASHPPSIHSPTPTPDTCGKIPYPNPASAWNIIQRLQHPSARHTHKVLHQKNIPYRCTLCHQWHITHKPPAKKPQRQTVSPPRHRYYLDAQP